MPPLFQLCFSQYSRIHLLFLAFFYELLGNSHDPMERKVLYDTPFDCLPSLLPGGELSCFPEQTDHLSFLDAPGHVSYTHLSGVRLREGRLEYTVIGGGEAAGICGSGLIDAMAALLRAGLVDETGCVDEENEPYSLLLTEQDGEPAVRCV